MTSCCLTQKAEAGEPFARLLFGGLYFTALALTRGIRGTNLFRTVYFMPNLIGGILLGYIWQILLNGVLANLEKPLLALDSTAGFWGLIILMCWQQIGYMIDRKSVV